MVRQSNVGFSLPSKELVVFEILRDSKCEECGKELGKGDFLFMERKHALCLGCADFDHLIYLPRGDAALTRRAKKYSALFSVVVRFSRSRGRYERQGILVEEAALERGEQECLADSQQRSRRRERDEVRRAEEAKNPGVQPRGIVCTTLGFLMRASPAHMTTNTYPCDRHHSREVRALTV